MLFVVSTKPNRAIKMKFDVAWLHGIKAVIEGGTQVGSRFSSIVFDSVPKLASAADTAPPRVVTPQVHISKIIPEDLHLPRAKTPEPRRAAVFIPLCNRHGEASVLFTVRSDYVGTHKGQVSFPGGHIDAHESAIEAAVREMYEELGDGIGPLQVLAVCQTVPAVTGTLVTPIIGFMESDVADFEHFQPHKGEVDTVFSRSIEQLTAPNYKTHELLTPGSSRSRGGLLRMPVFGADAGRERIWGLTAFVLDAILTRCIMPAAPLQEDASSIPIECSSSASSDECTAGGRSKI